MEEEEGEEEEETEEEDEEDALSQQGDPGQSSEVRPSCESLDRRWSVNDGKLNG